MSDRLVTVVIPVYNAERYLAETVESVLAQTHSKLECILVDDRSKDGSAGLMRELASRESRVLPVFLEENGGPGRARNQGIRKGRGDFFAFVDADDKWRPEKLERQLAAFEAAPELGLVATGVSWMGPSGEAGAASRSVPFRGRVSLQAFLEGVSIATSAVMVSRECLDQCGIFNESYRIAEDFDLWLRIAHRFEIEVLGEHLIHYRSHDTNISRDKLLIREMKLKVLEDTILSDPERSAEVTRPVRRKLQQMYCGLAKMYGKAGRREDARKALEKATEQRASTWMALKTWLYRRLYA